MKSAWPSAIADPKRAKVEGRFFLSFCVSPFPAQHANSNSLSFCLLCRDSRLRTHAAFQKRKWKSSVRRFDFLDSAPTTNDFYSWSFPSNLILFSSAARTGSAALIKRRTRASFFIVCEFNHRRSPLTVTQNRGKEGDVNTLRLFYFGSDLDLFTVKTASAANGNQERLKLSSNCARHRIDSQYNTHLNRISKTARFQLDNRRNGKQWNSLNFFLDWRSRGKQMKWIYNCERNFDSELERHEWGLIDFLFFSLTLRWNDRICTVLFTFVALWI